MIETKPIRQIPGWLSGAVAVGCVIVLGWFVWTSWLGAGPRERIVIMEKGPRDKVTSFRGYSEIRWGDVKVVVRKSETTEGESDFSFIDEIKRDVPPEQRKILQAMAELETQALLRGAVGLTPAQFEEVKLIRKGGAEPLPPDEQEKFKKLWTDYESAKSDDAKQRAAEKKLLKAVNDLDLKLKPMVLKSAAGRAAQGQSLLTAEQWQKFEGAKKRD